MTHQAPYRWQPPRPRPQHRAGAVRPSLPRHDQVRRALRLLVAAGTCIAGLCLVVGLVALVAALTESSRAANVAANSRATPAMITSVTGSGNRTVANLATARTGWRLSWSYACGPARTGRHLTVREVPVTGPPRTVVAARGQSGHGVSSVYHESGPHGLAVISGCSWKLRVVGRT